MTVADYVRAAVLVFILGAAAILGAVGALAVAWKANHELDWWANNAPPPVRPNVRKR